MAQSSQSKVALSVCRIRKLLSGDQGKATIGGGCIVSWTLEGEASNPPKMIPALITTTQVLSENDLISPSTSIVVEFLDREKLLTFDLGFKYASDFPDPIPGRVLRGTGNAVSFMVIPVEKFDHRNVLKRAYSSLRGSSFEKRSLSCSYQSDENLQLSISSRQVLSHVIRDGRSDASYNTEPYCLEFGMETSNFVLTSPLDHDGADDIKHLKDFHKDEKPRGAPLLSAEGKFVGMLAIVPSDERKLFPLFLPTLVNGDSSLHSKADRNSTVSDHVLLTSEVIVKPETSTGISGGSGQEAADESSCQEDRNKSTANNNQNLTYLGVQGSGNPVANSMQLDDSSPVCAIPNAQIPPEDQPHDELPEVEQLDLVEQDPTSDCSSLEQDDEPHSDSPEVSLSLNINENVHQPDQSANPQTRPNLLKENSYYGESFDSTSLKDEEWYPYGVDETENPKTQMSEGVSEETTDPSLSQESGGDLESSTEVDDTYLGRSFSDTFSSNGFSQPGHPNISETQHNTSPGELEHFGPDSLVQDKIVRKSKIMDSLSLYLDRSLCPGSRDAAQTQRWEQFADVFKVPYERKKQCENFTLSPSENMFEYLCTTHDSLPVKTVKGKLKKLGRKDVVAELDRNSSLDEATVTDLYENHPETLNAVCLKLDDKHALANWQDLGLKLGIPGGMLWKIKDPKGESPSEVIFKKLETLSPDLRITTIKAAFANELNLPAIAKVLSNLPAGSTIQTLLDNLDILDKVTAMLDRQESSWLKFGWKFKIDRKLLDSLKPDPIPSPTKLMMNYIVQDNPDLTMKTFLETLATIERYDVIKELKGFFHPSDIDQALYVE